ncbi:MAG: 2-oxoglutarate dehydrogenase E1 component [Anaerolineae bacterium]|nr:2-oxoglutarate dehydrogenase E1 component [Anaerolineae bacterium]
MPSQLDFHGPNAGYILALYEQYQQSPESVDAATRRFFQNWSPPANGSQVPVAAPGTVDFTKVVGAVNLAQSIRLFGHLDAQLDPLGHPPQGDPELLPQAHGLTEDDLRHMPASLIDSPLAAGLSNACEAIAALRAVYCASIGWDIEHVRVPAERLWLRDAIESRRYRFAGTDEEARDVLERLSQVEAFESFLQDTFATKYRFSVEGLDMMIPILDEIIAGAAQQGVKTVAIAMAHRGRLNVLAHIMNKPYQQILADFHDPRLAQEKVQAIGWTIGDVKYHKGVRHEWRDGETPDGLILTMPPNPSHLEQVNPVAVGMARAAGTTTARRGRPEFDPRKTMQILIHGDAAFPGQGIVAETFNLSRLPGYTTGGTIHIIANNQLGFTTLPVDSRSSLYASDPAKGYRVVIVHVNADDPAACIEVARLASAFQKRFEKDFLIDLVGYRRYGHNELDEPGFTQPLMYQRIRQHPRVRQLWTQRLIERGQVSAAEAEALFKTWYANLTAANEKVTEDDFAAERPATPPPGAAGTLITGIALERLAALNQGLSDTLDGFNFYSPRLQKAILSRRDILNEPEQPLIDWATAEELAFASILEEGIPIRLTGQDSERGTFSHRHAVLYDAKTGEPRSPLQRLRQATASFEVLNSPLSEAAAVAFEFGYNVQSPETLVLWEAQYGDFVNGAQVMIDEFIVSAREKWGQMTSLVMLLPHGHEGAGPDHSSARPERFLQMAARTNLRIANCTTAAQYFHILRRQALLLKTDPLPLIIMSPKSLLRNPLVAASVGDITGETRFQPIIDDAAADPAQINRLVFCSGKFYYDLVTSEHRAQYPHVAVVRVEQLYPFPAAQMQLILARYPQVQQVVWAQEEPKNMGAWEFMGYRLKKLVGMHLPVNYVGRRRSSSPAEGSKTAHQVNQAMITEYAFNWVFNH